jgi:SET domain-containing protein
MSQLTPSNKIYMAKSSIDGAGRGVFARVNIHEGEIIEESPIVDLSNEDFGSLKETILINYYFSWGETYDQVAVALGYGSLFNNSESPNAKFIKRFDSQLIEFVAIKDIEKDQEIFINYGDSENSK